VIEGVDYSWGRPDLGELARLGKRFAVRYLSFKRTGKNLTRAEADQLIAAGLAVVSNWENDKGDQLGGHNRGVAHATEAARQHLACGGPPDRPIYFSTDFDASTSQLATCHRYLRGCADVIGWDRVGVYGGFRTINYMRDRGVRWLWQTYAWSGGQWAAGTHLRQYRNEVRLAGADVDLDRAMKTDYGQWGEDTPLTGEDIEKIAQRVWGRENLSARQSYSEILRGTARRSELAEVRAMIVDLAGEDVAAVARQAIREEFAALAAALAEQLVAVPAERLERALLVVLGRPDED
jgi:Domain of unknown function (DUF1906)